MRDARRPRAHSGLGRRRERLAYLSVATFVGSAARRPTPFGWVSTQCHRARVGGARGAWRSSSIPVQLEQLTPREREVLELLAAGLDAGAIARALGISISTVRTRIRHIVATLRVHNQLAAVARAHRPRP
jgi:DNA-binding CsgD family transcriptional regulator